ncbi:ABC transporter substrate-binding protein [Gallibacterium anatis]|uniref:ABC transporter substrate-binding protein n=1 Tax=Gallibacterium anatis 12656/12 TaxID=1195244 RepID=U1GK78_9PAST|nr:efflux RND transporter periplasmic adaptor subunit [Gallibacterium anatis]ERF78057.1 ABC transporter substrate-binding protein [Gallibacterium anatis 12656/12]KGQ43581.1 ABC transporter substrate-binding protein [Gallibacterium anatis]KGQ59678.1 ABC transporter substrate-binding protein [Gallibacterium anatis]
MTFTKKRILGIAVILIILAAIYYFNLQSQPKTTYLTETAKYSDIQQTVVATGTVRSSNRVEVGARVSGKVEKILVKLGQKVKKGELIAELDSITQENTLNSAQAQLAAYKAQLVAAQTAYRVANSNFQRIAKLYKRKASSLDDYENAQNNLDSTKANVEQIQAQIKQSEIEVNTAATNLNYTKITSPIDGTVISIPVSVGQTVNANQTTPTIIQVADLDTMLIKPEISEGDITKIKPGMKVQFTTLAEPDEIYQAEIASVDPALTTLTDNEYSESVSDTNAIYYYANVLVPNPEHKLQIGMTTQNTIITAQKQHVLVVPTLAIQRKNGQNSVQILDGDKVIEKIVQIGLHDEINTEILSGLNEGDKVIISQSSANEAASVKVRTPRMM